jgi:hypothetical protein
MTANPKGLKTFGVFRFNYVTVIASGGTERGDLSSVLTTSIDILAL